MPLTSMPMCLVMAWIWVTLVGSVSLSGTLCCKIGREGSTGGRKCAKSQGRQGCSVSGGRA